MCSLMPVSLSSEEVKGFIFVLFEFCLVLVFCLSWLVDFFCFILFWFSESGLFV